MGLLVTITSLYCSESASHAPLQAASESTLVQCVICHERCSGTNPNVIVETCDAAASAGMHAVCATCASDAFAKGSLGNNLHCPACRKPYSDENKNNLMLNAVSPEDLYSHFKSQEDLKTSAADLAQEQAEADQEAAAHLIQDEGNFGDEVVELVPLDPIDQDDVARRITRQARIIAKQKKKINAQHYKLVCYVGGKRAHMLLAVYAGLHWLAKHKSSPTLNASMPAAKWIMLFGSLYMQRMKFERTVTENFTVEYQKF